MLRPIGLTTEQGPSTPPTGQGDPRASDVGPRLTSNIYLLNTYVVEVQLIMKKLLAMLGLGALAAASIKKAKAHHESEWSGLTESEARAKLDAKIPSRVPADKRTEISERVIEKMHERGLIEDHPSGDEPSSTAGTVDLREATADTVEIG